MKKLLTSAAIVACLVLSSPTQAAVTTLAGWMGNPVTEGPVTWTLISYAGDANPATSPLAGWTFAFSSAGFEVTQSGENISNPLIGPSGPYGFVYQAELDPGYFFSAVGVDSTVSLGADSRVQKYVSVQGENGWVQVASPVSHDGVPSGPSALPLPSLIQVDERLSVTSGALYSFNNTYGVVVPEPSTVVAGCLLVLPFAASTIRFMRKNRKA